MMCQSFFGWNVGALLFWIDIQGSENSTLTRKNGQFHVGGVSCCSQKIAARVTHFPIGR